MLVLALSFIVGTRFFGLFIVLPVLSLYALNLRGSNDFLVGLLVGVYAITQMIFQLPFGLLSDRIGRKKTMLIGLIIFIIGSLICSQAQSIYTMLLGRMIQGAGAVGAVAVAMISDFINEESRGRAMAIMGVFIGLSFAASMLISPLMSTKWGLGSLFDLSAALTLLCIILLYTVVPPEAKLRYESERSPLRLLFFQKNLALMNLTNFLQKMMMSIAFLSIPIVLIHQLGYPQERLWEVYAVGMVLGFLAMGFAGSLASKRGLEKTSLLAGVIFFILSFSCFALASEPGIFIIAVGVFFIAFNLHEPLMQSLASKFAKANERGSALGIFNAAGYGGSFVGGAGGGVFLHFDALGLLSLILIGLACIWFCLLLFLKNPNDLKNIYLPPDTPLSLDTLATTPPGLIEIYKNHQNLVLKFDSKLTSQEQLRRELGI